MGTKTTRWHSVVLLALLVSSSVLCLLPSEGEAQFFRRKVPLNRWYTVYGTIELIYERDWYTNIADTPPITTFTQNYELGLSGFIIDPRLVSFDGAIEVQDVNISGGGQGYSLVGGRLNAIILDRLPARLLKSWQFIPNPILLRFYHYNGPQDYTNYGITLRNAMPDEIIAFKKQQDPGARILYPTTYFDYDHYETKSGDEVSKNDLYSLRSWLTGRYFDYRLLLQSENQTGIAPYTRRTAELQPNYHFFDPVSNRSLDIANILRYDKVEDDKTVLVSSRPMYQRRFGRDWISVDGLARYRTFSRDNTKAYDSFINGQYNKVYSQRFTNTYGVNLGVSGVVGGPIDDERAHFERIYDNYTWDISKYLRNQGGAFVGINQNGFEYGFNAYLSTRTKIFSRVGYEFTSLRPDSGDATRHLASLEASGPLAGTLSFYVNVQYRLTDEKRNRSRSENLLFGNAFLNRPFTEHTQLYTGNLYWTFFRTYFSVGGTYAVVQTDFEDESVKNDNAGLTASILRPLTRRSVLFVYATWTRDAQGVETLEFRPRLTWSRGLTFVDLEYDYNELTYRDGRSSTDHRIYARIIRKFFRNFFF